MVKTRTQSNKLGLHLHHRQQNKTAAKTQRPKQHIQQTHPAEAKSEAQKAATETTRQQAKQVKKNRG
jgi:hypothetical protein